MTDDRRPFHNPFAVLGARPGQLPRPEPAPDPAPAPLPAAAAPRPPARAVVRLERAGRGGREVTLVTHLDLPPAELATWVTALKSALGCGGAVDGASIVLQGDQRQRVSTWLAGRGVRRVSAG